MACDPWMRPRHAVHGMMSLKLVLNLTKAIDTWHTANPAKLQLVSIELRRAISCRRCDSVCDTLQRSQQQSSRQCQPECVQPSNMPKSTHTLSKLCNSPTALRQQRAALSSTGTPCRHLGRLGGRQCGCPHCAQVAACFREYQSQAKRARHQVQERRLALHAASLAVAAWDSAALLTTTQHGQPACA